CGLRSRLGHHRHLPETGGAGPGRRVAELGGDLFPGEPLLPLDRNNLAAEFRLGVVHVQLLRCALRNPQANGAPPLDRTRVSRLGSPQHRRRPLMEPELVPYSPILHRPPLRWPNGARIALWVVPNIEHYEYLPKFVRTRDPWPRSPHPDLLGYTQRDYGNRVGLWRLF